MQLDQWTDWIRERWVGSRARRQFDFKTELAIAGLGVGGEAGEVQEHVKKFIRDGKEPDRQELMLELGDVVHYAFRIGQLFGIEAQEIAAANVAKLKLRDVKGKGNATA